MLSTSTFGILRVELATNLQSDPLRSNSIATTRYEAAITPSCSIRLQPLFPRRHLPGLEFHSNCLARSVVPLVGRLATERRMRKNNVVLLDVEPHKAPRG